MSRVDRGSVQVLLPADGTEPGTLDPRAEPVELTVPTDRAGTLPAVVGDPVHPAVGDRVVIDGDRVFVAPRTSELSRDGSDRTSLEQVIAANVDVVVIVEHLEPTPSLGRLERMLTIAWRSGAIPLVVLTKSDLVSDTEHWVGEAEAVAPGVGVVAVSASTGAGLDDLDTALAGAQTLVLIGPSGAGKSTLVNALSGSDVMITGAVRGDGRGMHTTTHRQLVPLPGGRLLIDTPGLRSVGIVATEEAVAATFEDIEALVALCRFNDCAHEQEPGCAVVAALDAGELSERRFTSWRKLQREARRQAARADQRVAAEQRRQWRTRERSSREAARQRARR
ncbi:ribosome small subunit-dependent GTPase A [Occultella glacieicola]|uniref:Small ribosomal subunit biogenesis GTPase RsgA n=1 Tax=Occultella glacieicola TaxID=2518684 RepID=A0ABY2DYN1_9MICO|nr:ribosome small subunit-dependent GTPase A [Occultella glacieicola]